ncbi:AprI/Inh family metalloprotease inhibitor [Microvirga aerophila]|uniref:Outer membrane lipoprotein omp19 n=1 Tax=Microvirga aerophila TaxID=670291 RepID=A0A512BKV4_9HYPH|nr:AprI/Inh family metalloprotease inhibitor [Microvirga aerophila]GEO12548.1 outer membrane lipoprotein omp19 [Microvirga aerophila]
MSRHGYALAATLCAVLALGACSSARIGGSPIRSAAAAPAPLEAEPVEAVPTGPISSAPLPPVEGQPLPPVAGAPMPTPGGTDVAGLPPAAAPAPIAPAAPAAPASRTAMVGNWTARDASGGSCRVQLSSAPALDLYKASASGCSNQDLSRVNAWDYRNGEVYLYQTGGAVAARLRGSSGSLSGVLAKSGAPLSLGR